MSCIVSYRIFNSCCEVYYCHFLGGGLWDCWGDRLASYMARIYPVFYNTEKWA